MDKDQGFGEQLAMRERAHRMAGQLIEWRRILHRHPELAFKEYQTSDYIAEVLQRIPGVVVARGLGTPTSVLGRLSGAQSGGPHVALRADLDGLPIEESDQSEIRSEIPGRMHACGHDGHMAMVLGAAHLLAEDAANGRIRGRVTFLFQPAEEASDAEGKTGARYLIEAGLLDDVDAVLALHCDPENPVGTVRIHDGAAMANVDNFVARIMGRGGHAGYPDLALDPLWLMVPVLQAIHGIRARRLSPLDGAAISVCQVSGGTANNVIPPFVELAGTLRSFNDGTRETIIDELSRAIRVAEALGGKVDLNIERGEPAVINSPAINAVLRSVVRDVTGRDSLDNGPFGMGGEDFGFMSRKAPAAMMFLGVASGHGEISSLHAPDFRLDEAALPYGTAILAEAALRLGGTQEA